MLTLSLSTATYGENKYTCPKCRATIVYYNKKMPPMACKCCFHDIVPRPGVIDSNSLYRQCYYWAGLKEVGNE